MCACVCVCANCIEASSVCRDVRERPLNHPVDCSRIFVRTYVCMSAGYICFVYVCMYVSSCVLPYVFGVIYIHMYV